MPKPEHVAALAQLVTHALVASPTAPKAAEALYAAIVTDPAAQDAVLAALVEGGRMVEEPDVYCLCGHHVAEHASDGCRWQWSSVRCACTILRPHRVRLVEPEWREATNE